MVVFSHCLSIVDLDARTSTLFESVLLNVTVVFVLISGYVFSHVHGHGRIAWGDFVRKRIGYLLVPYVLWSAPAIAYIVAEHPAIRDIGMYGAPVPLQVLELLATGRHLSNFWYVPVIFVVLMVAPLLLPIRQRPWFAPLVAVGVVVVALLGRWESGRYAYFFVVFLLGMLLHLRRPALERLLDRRWAVPALVALYLAGVAWVDAPAMHLMQKVALFLLLIGGLRTWLGALPMLDGLAELSFPIFLMHIYVINAIKAACTHLPVLHAAGETVLFVASGAAALAISYGVAAGLRRLLGRRSRYLVGA